MDNQEDNVAISFSGPESLKDWIREQAAKEKRTPSNWMRVQMERLKTATESAAG